MTTYPNKDQLRRIAMEAIDVASSEFYGKRFRVLVDGSAIEKQTVPALIKLLADCVADFDSIKPFRNMNGQATINLDS